VHFVGGIGAAHDAIRSLGPLKNAGASGGHGEV
jgi:hypothetical protein